MSDLDKMRTLLKEMSAEFIELPILNPWSGIPKESSWYIAVEETFFLFDMAGNFLGTRSGVTGILTPRGMDEPTS